MTRTKRFLASSTLIVAVGLPISAYANPSTPTAIVAQADAAATSEAARPADTAIRPFQFHATDRELADLKSRISATKWPSRELVNDITQGVQLATMQKLAQYSGERL